MTIALVTSIYGHHDALTDPPPQEGVSDYVAVVDEVQSGACGQWRQVVEPRPHMHPRLAAKVAKCLPELYTDAEYIIWMDGSCRLKHDRVAEWAVDVLKQTGCALAQFRHPQRFDITPEASVSAGMEKYFGQPVEQQAAYYKGLGLPNDWGLWACGFIVRRRDVGRDWGRRWLVEQMRWSYQDQISQPFCLWWADRRPVQLEGDLWSNPHLFFDGHLSGR